MDARPTTAIEYAPPLPRHRRLLKRWLLPAAAVALLASSYWWGPPAWFRVRLSYLERECASYTASPETIVYTEYADDTKRLAGLAGSRYKPGPNQNSVFLLPETWTRFYGLLSPPGLRSLGTVFLHERRTPSGRRVLVAVDFLGDQFKETGNFGIYAATFQVRSFRPGGAFALPVETQTDRVAPVLYSYASSPGPLRLRAGQPDSNDPTHFTINWEVPDAPDVGGVIDGWVREDGVYLEPAARTTPVRKSGS